MTGATVRFGLPITENLSTQLAYNFSEEEYDFGDGCDANDDRRPRALDATSRNAIIQGIAASPWIKSSVSGGVVYNTIDDMKNPHAGIFANITTEVAGLGGDAQFVKLTARGSYYHTLSEEMDIVGLLSAGGGHIAGLRRRRAAHVRPVPEQRPHDPRLRVWRHRSDRRRRRGDHLGGTTYFNASAEAQFPMPVIPESFGLRGAVFADAATLYGNELEACRHDGCRRPAWNGARRSAPA